MRDRQRQTDRDRQTDRQTDRDTERRKFTAAGSQSKLHSNQTPGLRTVDGFEFSEKEEF